MRRPVRWTAALGVGVALAAAAPVTPARGQGGPGLAIADRAYTVAAEAFPVEPAPGSQSQPVAIRPLASRIALANPPATAYARAAATDLGLAEGYVGQQGPSAEADTSVEGQPPSEDIDSGGAVLHAAVTEVPHAEATAEGTAGGLQGSAASRAMGDGGTGVLVAEASSVIQDLTAGPLTIGSGRFEATVSVDGTPGGASGTGRVVITGTTIGGIPVVIDDEGVRVDETAVPVALLEPLTAGVQAMLAQGGYTDVRVVQPAVVVADDGTAAEVSGGGVRFYGTNNDPTNRYFISLTVLGGRAAIRLGAPFAGAAADRPADVAEPASPPTGHPAATAAPDAPAAGGVGVAVETPSAGPAALDLADASATITLRGIWPGWPWLLLGAAAVLTGSWAALRLPAVRRRAQGLLDGYGRG